jgi:DNA-binding beta-propeller fold protein YncE
VSARRQTSVVLVALVMLAVWAVPADAATRLGYVGIEIGSGVLSRPNGVAIDQATGNVYVADHESNVVDVFGAEGGSPVGGGPSQLTGAEAPEPFDFGSSSEPVGIAVDNSGGSSNGDIYVVDIVHGVVDKFTLNSSHEYEYLCQLTGTGGGGGCHKNEPTIEAVAEFKEPTGIAVDSHGNVYVSDWGNRAVDEFDAEGMDIANAAGGQVKELPLMTGHPASLTAAPGGVFFIKNYEPNPRVIEVKLNSLGEVEPGSEKEISSSPTATAVDPSTSDLYIDEGSEVREYNTQGELLEKLNLPGFESEGVAVDGATHRVYVSDAAHGDVKVFGPATVPDVSLCGASQLEATSATLTGTVNPLDTEGANYHFQYGISSNYETETLATSIEGNLVLPAEAPVTGLEPGTTYHCRLDAANNTGAANESKDATFTTPPLKPVVEEPEAPTTPVSNISTTGATFNGRVNPGNGPTTYHFAYGTEAGNYYQSLPNIGIGTGRESIPVEQQTPQELHPGIVYHFVLIAENAAGTTSGPDHEFTTPATAPPPTRMPGVSATTAINIDQTEATLVGTITSENLATTYTFELGYAAGSYETRIFGNLAGEPEPKGATATFANLQPGTVYHYRVVATNAAGPTESADQTFTTATFPQNITIPPTPLLVPTPVFPPVHYNTSCKKGYVKHANKCVRTKPPKHKKPKKHHR